MFSKQYTKVLVATETPLNTSNSTSADAPSIACTLTNEACDAVSGSLARMTGMTSTVRQVDSSIIPDRRINSTRTKLFGRSPIQVTYTREQEPFAFQRARRPTTVGNPALFQRSLLRMLEPDLTLEPNGQFWPARGFRSEGYWAWELVADDLPWDYDPSEPLDSQ